MDVRIAGANTNRMGPEQKPSARRSDGFQSFLCRYLAMYACLACVLCIEIDFCAASVAETASCLLHPKSLVLSVSARFKLVTSPQLACACMAVVCSCIIGVSDALGLPGAAETAFA